jgi:hypothetical protein
MDNRIRTIHVTDSRLDPTEAEVYVLVYPERLTSSTQVRGRLVGPRSPYTTTVEVAYPLREHSRQYESEGPARVILRVVIPEPNLWDPQTAFLYEGPLELWQGGQLAQQLQLRHGLRVTRMGPRALEMNGKPIKVCGIRRSKCTDHQAELLHGKGHNTLLASAVEDESLWDTADRWGFLMIHCLTEKADLKLASSLKEHPCCLGWLVAEGPEHEELLAAALALADPVRGHYVGVELDFAPECPLPRGASFLACAAENLAALEQIPLPKLALVPARADDAAEPTFAESAAVLGWISE